MSGEKPAIVEALLAVTARLGWQNVTFAAIAAEAGTSLLSLRRAYPDKNAILDAYFAWLDEAMLAGGAPDAGDPARERLFEILIRRFEAMAPYRNAVRSILADGARDPFRWPAQARHLHESMALALEAAGVSASGLLGKARVGGLASLYLLVMRKWLSEEDPELGNTMAELERLLRRGESILTYLDRDKRAGDDTATETDRESI